MAETNELTKDSVVREAVKQGPLVVALVWAVMHLAGTIEAKDAQIMKVLEGYHEAQKAAALVNQETVTVLERIEERLAEVTGSASGPIR